MSSPALAEHPRAPVAQPATGQGHACRTVTVGTVGSALLAVGALGVGALPRGGRPVAQLGWFGVDLLREGGAARAGATVLCVTGLLLLLAAWLRLRAATARVLLSAAGLWSLPLLLAPPVFSRDVYAYAAQGALVGAGIDPYTHGPAALPGPLADSVVAQYAHVPSPYGPAFLALARFAGPHVVPGVLALRLLAVAGLLLAAWALPRLAAQQADPQPGRALWLGLANPLVVVHGVGGAHNDLLMVGLLVAGLALGHSRTAAGAVLVTLGGLVKAPALAGLAVLPLLRPSRRTPLTVALAAALTAGVVTAAGGLTLGWLRTSGQGVAGPSLLSPTYGLGRALAAAGVPHGLAAGRTAGTVLALGLAAGLLLAAPRVGPLRALGLALLAVAALAPAVQPWYLLWALLPLAPVVGERGARALAAGSVVLCLAVLPSGVPLLHGPTWGLPVLLASAAGLLAARRSALAQAHP